MNHKILVYDDFNDYFRDLNMSNYDDDIIVGTVLLRREAIKVLKKYYIICGYVLIGKEGNLYPIDIREEDIAIFEGTYNCMPTDVKAELIEYNIVEKPRMIWSRFFFQWQFLCDWNAFKNNGSFIEMISNIIGNEDKLKQLIKKRYNLVMPSNYCELSEFVQNVGELFSTDFYMPEYIEEANYIIDSLIKGYHINLTRSEVEKYCFQVSTIINNKWVN